MHRKYPPGAKIRLHKPIFGCIWKASKKCSLNLVVFHKGGGGGIASRSKSFGALFVHQPFWNVG